MDFGALNKSVTKLIKSVGNNQACKVVSAKTSKKLSGSVVLTGVSKDDLPLVPQGAPVSQVSKTAYVTCGSLNDTIEITDTLQIGSQLYTVMHVFSFQPDLRSVNILWKLLVVQ